jgi:hypothetical protein
MVFLMLIAARTGPLFRRELRILGLTFVVCSILLALGAIFETAAIFVGNIAVVVGWIVFDGALAAAVYLDADRRGIKLPNPSITLVLIELGTIIGFATPTLLIFVALIWIKHIKWVRTGQRVTTAERAKPNANE